MRYRTFPNTAISVSEVGFGTWTVSTGWWGEKSDAEAIGMMRRALDTDGVTFFDAADAYGNGRAERQIAEAFRGRRQEIVIGTKVGYDIYDEAALAARRGQAELPMRTDPAFIRSAVDRCLERLETEYIDVLQIHNAKMEHVRDPELWGTLRELKREGKIRAWGAAFGPAIGWLYEAVELMEREPDVNTIQMIWNVLEQHPGSAMIEAARRSAPDCCFNIRVTHASGMLEGHYTADTVFPESDHRRHRPRSWLVNGVEKVKTLEFMTSPSMTLGQAALKWLLAEPLVVTTLPNVYDDAQLDEFAAAVDLPDLSIEVLERVHVLDATNFGVDEEPMKYKGAMTREAGAGVDLQDARNPVSRPSMTTSARGA
jgi:aryl-alcohol dehydrogenase-like predicted oxidoreductase